MEHNFAHYWIILLTLLGFFSIPPQIFRLKWIFLFWFLAVNILFFARARLFFSMDYPYFYLLITHIPWILISAYFFTAYKQKRFVINEGHWLTWSLFQIIQFEIIFNPNSQHVSLIFINRVFNFTTIQILLTLIVLLFIKMNWPGQKPLFMLWNILGLSLTWILSTQLGAYVVQGPHASPEWLVVQYYKGFPELWISCFWIPVSILLHVVILYHQIKSPKSLTAV